MRTAWEEAGTAEEHDAGRLRAAQSACYEAEDFARYFVLSGRLAALDPGYARSYEVWVQTVLHALGRREPGLRFLQVGAMDGKRFDPVYAFAKHYAWRGLVLEPLPDLFALLAERGYRVRMSESDVMAVAPALHEAIDAEIGWPC